MRTPIAWEVSTSQPTLPRARVRAAAVVTIISSSDQSPSSSPARHRLLGGLWPPPGEAGAARRPQRRDPGRYHVPWKSWLAYAPLTALLVACRIIAISTLSRPTGRSPRS
jgi:hypothetical protein